MDGILLIITYLIGLGLAIYFLRTVYTTEGQISLWDILMSLLIWLFSPFSAIIGVLFAILFCIDKLKDIVLIKK